LQSRFYVTEEEIRKGSISRYVLAYSECTLILQSVCEGIFVPIKGKTDFFF
jgi:hypothetical protein